MADIAELDRPKTDAPDKVEATLNYLADTGGVPVTLVGDYGDSDTRTGGGQSDPHRVVIHNGRLADERFDLHRHGFSFVPHRTRITDFFDDDQLRRVYYPEMEALIKAESGAKRVVVFDHTLRTEDERLRRERKIREVVRRVHNDYTEWSAPQRVRQIMGDEAEELLKGRFGIIQVWRPFNRPVETWPLAIADGRSISDRDMVVTERRYPDRIGQTFATVYNPAHRWYWFPRMRPEEALVFKVYDSQREGTVRWTAHTAFDDPTSPPSPPPRESIEIRTLAFF